MSLNAIPLVLGIKSASQSDYGSKQVTHDSTVLISNIYCMRHGKDTRHGCTDIESRLIKMIHTFNMLERESATPNHFAPNLLENQRPRGFLQKTNKKKKRQD